MKGDISGKDSLDPLDPLSNPRTRHATRSVVFVLDASHRPLAPCHPARARRLLARQRAAVWRAQPFTLILRTRTDIPPETVQDTLQDMAAGAMASDEHREAAEVPNGSPLTGA